MKHLACKLCGNSDLHFVTKQLRRGAGEIYRCILCDYEFLIKKPRNEKEFYEKQYWQSVGPSITSNSDYESIFNSYVLFQTNRLKLLNPILDLDKTVIEIGCSTGHFLFNIKNRVKKIVGVDFDEKALEKCKEKNSCEVIGGGIDHCIDILNGEKFDILCCFQVLEHVEDVDDFLSKIKKLLKKDGFVYIEVPNLKDPLLSLYDIPQYHKFYYHEDHLHYFSKKSLKILLDRNKFLGNFTCYQDYNLINHVNWINTGQPQVSCLNALGNPSINFSNTVTSKNYEIITKLFHEFNQKYLSKLSELEFTDNLAFLGCVEK